MRQTRIPFVAGVVLLALLLGGCATSTSAPTTIPEGTYYGNSGASSDQLKLSGGSYLVVVQGASVVEGSYTSTNREVTLTTGPTSAVCLTALKPATYRWNFKDNHPHV